MPKHIHILGIVAGLLLIAACSASPATTTNSTSPAASLTSAPNSTSPVDAIDISISDPWARAAAMTGASASGEMSQSETASGTAVMTSTMEMGNDHATSGGTSAAYMEITNSGSTADALIKAESDVADSVELHTMTMEGDVMKMTPVEKVDIPANGSATLKPGSFHIMLIGLRHDLKEGEAVTLTLTFQNAGTIQVEAPVRKP